MPGNNGKWWSEEEKQRLRETWGTRTVKELQTLFPGRTTGSITRERVTLGLAPMPSPIIRNLPDEPLAAAVKRLHKTPPAAQVWLAQPVYYARTCQFLIHGPGRFPETQPMCGAVAVRASWCSEHAERMFQKRKITEAA